MVKLSVSYFLPVETVLYSARISVTFTHQDLKNMFQDSVRRRNDCIRIMLYKLDARIRNVVAHRFREKEINKQMIPNATLCDRSRDDPCSCVLPSQPHGFLCPSYAACPANSFKSRSLQSAVAKSNLGVLSIDAAELRSLAVGQVIHGALGQVEASGAVDGEDVDGLAVVGDAVAGTALRGLC